MKRHAQAWHTPFILNTKCCTQEGAHPLSRARFQAQKLLAPQRETDYISHRCLCGRTMTHISKKRRQRRKKLSLPPLFVFFYLSCHRYSQLLVAFFPLLASASISRELRSPTTQMISPTVNLREGLIMVKFCWPSSTPTTMQL